MSELRGFGALAKDFERMERRYRRSIDKALRKTGKAIQKEAKGVFGHYQEGWPALSPSWQKRREALGFAPDDPLLMTGALRDQVKVKVEGEGPAPAAFVGMEAGQTYEGYDGRELDAAEIMATHEYGRLDGSIPARPVFGVVANRIEKHQDAFADEVLRDLKL